MLNNRSRPGTYVNHHNLKYALPNGNGIYDFNAERWNFHFTNKEDDETEADIDKKLMRIVNQISLIK